jgi:succinate dehydrogenase / fumarate reductase cytochrome b subunit
MPDLTIKKSRPVWYNLSPVNLPIPGLVSIFHRISGLLLVLGLLWMLYLLDMSLGSEAGYQRFREYMAHPASKLGMLILLWSFMHHLCAGIRYLLLDVHVGISLANARLTSFAVFAISLIATVLVGVALW